MKITHMGVLGLHCSPTHRIKVLSPLEMVLEAILRSQLPSVIVSCTVERVEQVGEATIDGKF